MSALEWSLTLLNVDSTGVSLTTGMQPRVQTYRKHSGQFAPAFPCWLRARILCYKTDTKELEWGMRVADVLPCRLAFGESQRDWKGPEKMV